MKIQVTNQATSVSMEEALLWTTACAAQVREEFSAAWERVPPTIEFSGDGNVDPDAYHVLLLDDATQAGALGWHDTDSEGKPRAFVFAKTSKDAGEEPSVTLSHEILEMFLDPSCTLWTQTADGNMRAMEASDAVQSASYLKRVGDTDVPVSDWLTPNYFSQTPIAGEKFDYLGKLDGPAPARLAGGYDIVIRTAGEADQEFSRLFALLPGWKQKLKERSSSRTSRRRRLA